MAYNTKKMLTDADDKLIPQIYDTVADEFKPLSTDVYNNINVNNFPATQQVEGNVQLTGSSTALDVNVLNSAGGSSLQEQQTEADAVSGVLTFSDAISEIEIFNRDTADGTFTVNGMAIIVPASEVFQAKVGGTPSNEVSVSGSTSYIVGRYA